MTYQPMEAAMGKQATRTFEVAPLGYQWIFRPWIHDPRTGRIRYPKRARFFKLLVKG
jgi:hypothetical protein